jgi:hypothetical protein
MPGSVTPPGEEGNPWKAGWRLGLGLRYQAFPIGLGSLSAQAEVEYPTAADVKAVEPAVIEHRRIRAACRFQGVCKRAHAVKRAFVGNAFCQSLHRLSGP